MNNKNDITKKSSYEFFIFLLKLLGIIAVVLGLVYFSIKNDYKFENDSSYRNTVIIMGIFGCLGFLIRYLIEKSYKEKNKEIPSLIGNIILVLIIISLIAVFPIVIRIASVLIFGSDPNVPYL